MESRFLRFGRSKREKSSPPKLDTGFQSISYDTACQPATEPIFIHQPLGKSTRESQRLDDQCLLLKGFAYDAQPQGKPPQFIGLSPKGNGPVKLQTSRRLSSGELLVTTQHNQRTLEDIREGDYIVGQKSKHDSVLQPDNPGLQQSTAAGPRMSYSSRSRPSTSRSARTNRDSNWSSAPITPTSPVRGSDLSFKSTPAAGLGIVSESEAPLNAPLTAQHTPSETKDRSPYVKPQEEQSATITALWKAEYGRLIKLYGHEGVEQDVLLYGFPVPTRGLSQSSAKHRAPSVPVALDPLPQPGFDGVSTKRSSDGSSRSSNYPDEVFEGFSQSRESSSSSWAASSTSTAQTNTSEVESPTTRDNIKKMIEDMRSNYLHAIESQSSTMIKKKSTKKRRKPRLGASPNLGGTHSSKDRQTWHGQDAASETTDEQLKRRTASHPIHGHGRLSPIEASPSRVDDQTDTRSTDKPIPDLKRADSMTLGGLMRQIPECPDESGDRTQKTVTSTQTRPKTAVRPENGGWLKLDLPTSTFLSGLSKNEGSTVNIEELMTPRYIPPTKDIPRPTTAPVNSKTQSSVPRLPPPRPAPPPMSLATLVNFI